MKWMLLMAAVAGCSGAVKPAAQSVAAPPPPAAAAALPPIEPLGAPFPMADLQRPRFPDASFDIRRFGAIPGGTVKNTEAFKKAVAAAVAVGGGHVVVPPGRWLTGPIHLESHIDLEVQAGAEILFSQDFADYLPPVFTRFEGLEVYNYSPLVYAHDCTDVAITGAGKLDGQGKPWWAWKKKQGAGAKRLYEMALAGVPANQRVFGTEEAGLRPSFIQTINCKNVLIEGVTISNGPMWTIHPVYSENVIIRKVNVVTEGPNNDGFNPDSCKNVLVEDSFFSTGDDCIVLKSGLNEDGWRVGRPTENVVVRRVRGALGHGGVVIGSEMSGGVRNVYVHDCEFTGTDRGLRIKSMRGRGAVVENVWYEKVRHKDLRLMVVEITTFYGSSTLVPHTTTPPTIRGVHVRDVFAQGAKKAMEIVGLPEAPIQDVSFENVDVTSTDGARCVDVAGARFDRVKITPAQGTPFLVENASGVAIDHSCAPGWGPNCVSVAGRAERVTIDGAPAAEPQRAVLKQK